MMDRLGFRYHQFNSYEEVPRRKFKMTKEEVANLKWYLEQNHTMKRRQELAARYGISTGYVSQIYYGECCASIEPLEPEEIEFQ